MKNHGVILLGFALALLIGVADAGEASAQVLHGCYNKSGVLYLIDEPDLKTDCKDDHVPVDWSITGPPGPQGIQGIQGPQGTQGPPGISGYVQVSETATGLATAVCPAGKKVLGGGHTPVLVFASFPGVDSMGNHTWSVVAQDSNDAVTAIAICATVAS